MTKYLYWIGAEQAQSGSYETREEAEQAIARGKADGWLDPDAKIEVIAHEADICPTCGQIAEKDIIDGLGECLRCDHVRGDVMLDREPEEEDDLEYN